MATRYLVSDVKGWIDRLARHLDARVSWRLLPLLTGLLFATGRRTVSQTGQDISRIGTLARPGIPAELPMPSRTSKSGSELFVSTTATLTRSRAPVKAWMELG